MPEQITSLPRDKQYHGSFKQLADARRVLKIAAKLNGHPVLPAEQRQLLAQVRVAAELVIADAVDELLETLDAIGGDPDNEPNGDELDGTNAEDEEGNCHFNYGLGPGCPISDPDYGAEEAGEREEGV